MLSKVQIDEAISQAPRQLENQPISHDGMRAAYEWLDAQQTIKQPSTKPRPLKHIIEKWAGCYVSQSDVEIAAWIHPEMDGSYSKFNISSKLTRPAAERLEKLGRKDAVQNWPTWPETGEAYEYTVQEKNEFLLF